MVQCPQLCIYSGFFCRALADLDAELVELNETERTTSASHREVSEQIGRVTSNIEAGERFLERFGVDAMTAAKCVFADVLFLF